MHPSLCSTGKKNKVTIDSQTTQPPLSSLRVSRLGHRKVSKSGHPLGRTLSSLPRWGCDFCVHPDWLLQSSSIP